MKDIKVAIVGVGNCASSLLQGVEYYKEVSGDDPLTPGLMHNVLGGYRIKDIKFVAAFDVDSKKVGKDLSEAVFSEPNCTKKFSSVPKWNVSVQKSPVLDGVAETTREKFTVDEKQKPVKVANALTESGAEVLVSYLPVGSEEATRHYAKECLKAGVAFINAIPVFIASNKEWSAKFAEKKLPVIGDDIKSQVGATIVHRMLTRLFVDRGVKLDHTYQLNVGGNSVTGDQEILLLVNGKLRKVRIGELIDSFIDVYGKKRWDGKDIVAVEETKQDIKCFTTDGDYNVVLSDVDALIRHRISEPIYEITTEEGRKIKITGSHNVFTLDDEGNLKEIPVKLVKEDETYIAVPKALNCFIQEEVESIDLTPYLNDLFVREISDGYLKVHNHPEIKIPVEFPITDELLQIIGLWLADGNFDRSGSSNIELACGREPECMEIIDKFVDEININYNLRSDGVRLLSKTLSKILKLAIGLGGNAYTKRVPEWIFSLPERQIALVLKGYLSGDGGVTGKQIRWTSVSEGLIRDIQTVFLRVGINSTIFKARHGDYASSYNTSLNHVWHGIISSKGDMESFITKVGFLQEFKNKKALEIHGKLKKHSMHRIPNIPLLKKWRIKSTTGHKHSSIRAHIVLSQLDKIKDEFEKEKIRNICSNDARFLKIKKVKQIKTGDVYVYDISTKPFERFICSNILVHNTDFLNMLERTRLKSKKISKTQSVQSQLPTQLPAEDIHIGPSDYIPWINDKKICFIRMEGRKFGDVPLVVDLRLDVEDSPNSAGVMVDAIRCAKIALERGVGGALTSPSSYFMKSPPIQYTDAVAREMVEEFIKGERER